ncbi:hypothetical protein BRPE64_BCDS10560 [Caballeronia insecticola]|uniref:Uncharacterized protein n=1 Tax=Caballeronia insecticola TaxID=758793 RepID=R4X2L9_9BURK|nr:hypothetical protein BRPE64_BCDS10560 [Caballeronia insecticola]
MGNLFPPGQKSCSQPRLVSHPLLKNSKNREIQPSRSEHCSTDTKNDDMAL